MKQYEIAQMTGQNKTKISDWSRQRPALYALLEFGCQKAIDAIPEGWAYTFVIDHPHQHIFVHENYAPDIDDGDFDNIATGRTFIEGLEEIRERTE